MKIILHIKVVLMLACFWGGTLTSANLTAAIKNGERAQIYMDTSGNALSIWHAVDNSTGTHVIQSAFYTALTSTWSSPTVISTAGIDSYSPIMATNSLGNTVALWLITDTSTGISRLCSSTCSSLLGGTWTTPKNVSNASENVANDYRVTINTAGQVMATWSSFVTINTRVRSATSLFGGNWTNPQTISDP